MDSENVSSTEAPAEFEVEKTADEVRVKPAKRGKNSVAATAESDVKDIKDLPGIGAATAAKLKEAGYDDVETIAYALPAELAEAAGIGDATAIKAIGAARKTMKMDFETGTEEMRKRELVQCITTDRKSAVRERV